MPQATDLVVKNGANVDKTFSLISPASGDGGVAIWYLKEGAVSAAFPRLQASAYKQTGTKSRKLKVKLEIPTVFTDSITQQSAIGPIAMFDVNVAMPDFFLEAQKSDFVAFATNVLSTALMKAMVRDAVPAT